MRRGLIFGPPGRELAAGSSRTSLARPRLHGPTSRRDQPSCPRRLRRQVRRARRRAGRALPRRRTRTTTRCRWTTSCGRSPGRRPDVGRRHRLRRRGRRPPAAPLLRTAAEGLALIGVDAATVERRDHHPPALRPRRRLRPVPVGPLPRAGPRGRVRHRPPHDRPALSARLHAEHIADFVLGRPRRTGRVPRRRRRARARPLGAPRRRSHRRPAGRPGRHRRGWLVLASDAVHYYENIERRRPFPIVFDVGAMLAGLRPPARAGRRPPTASSPATTRSCCAATRPPATAWPRRRSGSTPCRPTPDGGAAAASAPRSVELSGRGRFPSESARCSRPPSARSWCRRPSPATTACGSASFAARSSSTTRPAPSRPDAPRWTMRPATSSASSTTSRSGRSSSRVSRVATSTGSSSSASSTAPSPSRSGSWRAGPSRSPPSTAPTASAASVAVPPRPTRPTGPGAARPAATWRSPA